MLHRTGRSALGAILAVGLLTGSSPSIAAPDGGTQVWAARYKPGRGTPIDVVVSPDGAHVYVTGNSFNPTSHSDYVTVAYDAVTGAQEWASRFDGVSGGDDTVAGLAVSPDGTRVFVTGASRGPHYSFDYVTIAYVAATGAEAWAARFNGPAAQDDGARAIGVSPDGARLFVTGSTATLSRFYDYATLAYDTASGAQLWVRRYDGPGERSFDIPVALGVASDGRRVFVTGSAAGSSREDFATVAYDAISGARLWASRYNSHGNLYDTPRALAVSPNGERVFITGDSEAFAAADWATVAYAADTGARLWARRFDGGAHGNDFAHSIVLGPDGTHVYVTGSSFGPSTSEDYATVAYSAASGASLWVRRYNGPGNGADGAFSLAPSSDGRLIFATGSSYGVASFDYATLAYDALSGATMWKARYDGPVSGYDAAWAIVASPTGPWCYVTGQSYGTGPDFATVAYRST
jgi:DNA-binding beta-propeller fold protein YncE